MQVTYSAGKNVLKNILRKILRYRVFGPSKEKKTVAKIGFPPFNYSNSPALSGHETLLLQKREIKFCENVPK